MNPHREWYATKRDEFYRAYQAALEMEEIGFSKNMNVTLN